MSHHHDDEEAERIARQIASSNFIEELPNEKISMDFEEEAQSELPNENICLDLDEEAVRLATIIASQWSGFIEEPPSEEISLDSEEEAQSELRHENIEELVRIANLIGSQSSSFIEEPPAEEISLDFDEEAQSELPDEKISLDYDEEAVRIARLDFGKFFGRATNEQRMLLEERVKYKSRHRDKDKTLLSELWFLEREKQVIHFKDTSAKVQKKWKRAVMVHKSVWDYEMEKMSSLYQLPWSESVISEIIAATTKVIKSIKSNIPRLQNYIIIDATDDGLRENEAEWDQWGVTVTLFWALYRRATANLDAKNFVAVIRDAEEALSLLPLLQDGSFPSKNEVVLRYHRAKALREQGDLEQALSDFRVCAAASRLLMHSGKADSSDDSDFLRKKCAGLVPDILRLMVKIKIRSEEKRPLFSSHERSSIEKELGVGLYSSLNYLCGNCRQPPSEVKLYRCLGCLDAWYCSRKCQRAAWKKAHSKHCGNGRAPILSPTFKHTLISQIEDGGGVAVHHSLVRGELLIQCYDRKADEVFEPFTDGVTIFEHHDSDSE